MNDEALITALLANLGDPNELVRRSRNIETPRVSQRAENAFKRKFALLGRAMAHVSIIKFAKRLRSAIDQDKAKKAAESKKEQVSAPSVPTEGQYKTPGDFHTRNQSAFPSSINPTMSFGGVVAGKIGKKKHARKLTPKEELELKLDGAFGAINEELTMKHGGSMLAAERGRFIVDGEVAIDNHADLLKILVLWLVDNRPEVMQSAVDGIGEMVRSGTAFRK